MGGFGTDGFFQEYVVTHWRNPLALPEGLDQYDAAPLFCAGITSWHGVTGAGIKRLDGCHRLRWAVRSRYVLEVARAL
jgi:D-arabinose 1-dehydrogenase-like Zn-dependent alcohol dehydrogenase